MKKSKLLLVSLVNSLGVLVYTSLVVFIMNNGEKLFGQKSPFLGGLAILMLFVLSAITTSSLVLGRPIYLYLQGLKSEAVKMLIYTVAFLFVITTLVLLSLFWLK
jgi:hypothetical protein